MTFSGFPRRVRLVPVPSPVFGPLLEEIDDLAELKCTLRVVWLLQQKRGYPKLVTASEVLADRTLARALSPNGSTDPSRVEQALARAVQRGTLITGAVSHDGARERLYALNSDGDREAMAKIVDGDVPRTPAPKAEPWEAATERSNIFALYEDNIGMLSPMISEELREAEQIYPAAWIEDALREAVGQNKRSWRYIARILERWEREGRGDGEPGRHPKKAGYY